MEVFRKIEGYDNKYSVSNMRRVRKDSTGKILKKSILQYGDDHYEVVSLYKDGKYEKIRAYKLAADEFTNNLGVKEDIYWNNDYNQWCADIITSDEIRIRLGYFENVEGAEYALYLFNQVL
jgi:hypothetical protein